MFTQKYKACSLLLVVLVALNLGGCVSIATPIRGEFTFKEILIQGSGNAKILALDIIGVVSNESIFVPEIGFVPGMVSRLRQELEIALMDDSIRGILLRINSVGGTLTDSDIIYNQLVQFKRRKNVHIVASIGDIAASGGLYVAMAADEIYAHPTSITGNVGVILPRIDYTGLMENLGIKDGSISSGRFKDIGSEYKKIGDEERKIMQNIVDQQHQRFIDVIEDNRDISNKNIEIIGDGRIITAQDALNYGLIDAIGYLDNAYERIIELSQAKSARLVRYANSWATGQNIYSIVAPVEYILSKP